MTARVLAVPNPLLDPKLSWAELPNSLSETGLWVGVGRGGGREGAVGSPSSSLLRGSSLGARLRCGESTARWVFAFLWELASDMPFWLDVQVKGCLKRSRVFKLLFLTLVGDFLIRSKPSAEALERDDHMVKGWDYLSVDFSMVFWVFTRKSPWLGGDHLDLWQESSTMESAMSRAW